MPGIGGLIQRLAQRRRLEPGGLDMARQIADARAAGMDADTVGGMDRQYQDAMSAAIPIVERLQQGKNLNQYSSMFTPETLKSMWGFEGELPDQAVIMQRSGQGFSEEDARTLADTADRERAAELFYRMGQQHFGGRNG